MEPVLAAEDKTAVREKQEKGKFRKKFMIRMNEIPDRFWSLFRSVNRGVYLDALLRINEEYEYSNYFLSRETCIRLLGESFAARKYVLWQEELEEEADEQEPPAARMLNWLVRTGWLRRVDDYASMTVNIVIPDYASVFIEAFERLVTEDEDETQIYIQNIYAVLFALKNDSRAGIGLLDTAVVNTKKLNKVLQTLLHNMDRFFSRLLEQKTYQELLRDHLEGYVEEVVRKKYHMLKTSDNFYRYKTDIKYWLNQMREDEAWLLELAKRTLLNRGLLSDSQRETSERLQQVMASILEKLDTIERGFDDIERRIANMDKEHSRYVRATVTRLHYLLNREDNMKGLLLLLLSHLSEEPEDGMLFAETAERMNLSQVSVLSEASLYKQRHLRKEFPDSVPKEEEVRELSVSEILELNRVKARYSRQEIESFVAEKMADGRLETGEQTVQSREDFEKLILAYDYSVQQNCPYRCEAEPEEQIKVNGYAYPKLTFVKKTVVEEEK